MGSSHSSSGGHAECDLNQNQLSGLLYDACVGRAGTMALRLGQISALSISASQSQIFRQFHHQSPCHYIRMDQNKTNVLRILWGILLCVRLASTSTSTSSNTSLHLIETN